MKGHEIAQCRVIHDQGRVLGHQYKPSQKIIYDERDQGRIVAPKQRKEYQKKDLQPKLVEDPTDKLNIDIPGGANAEPPLDHLAFDKPGGVEDDFADMPPFEDASDHKSMQGLSTYTSNFPEQGMLPAVTQAKGSKSHATIEDHHVEVWAPVAVPSPLRLTFPRKAKSPADSTTPINTPIDGHHVDSAIVTVPSPSLVLQNHFSSLSGLETIDVGSDPYIVTAPFDDHHVEIFAHVVVCPTSSRMGKSPAGSNVPTIYLINGDHVEVSTIVTIPSSSPYTSPRKAKPFGMLKHYCWSCKITFPLLMV